MPWRPNNKSDKGASAHDVAAMPGTRTRHPFLLAIAALLGSGVLFFYGTGLHPLWWLTWLAPFPVLFAAPRLRAWPAFAMAGCAWTLGGLNMLPQARAVEMPLGLVLVLLMVPACIFGFVVLLFRAWVRRGFLGLAALAFACAWVSAEFLNAQTSVHGTFANFGYTQLDCLPLIQVASLVGIWGISFCLLLPSATAAALLSPQGTLGQKAALAVVVSAVLVAVIGYGFLRLHSESGPEPAVKIGLIATDAGNTFPDLFPREDKSALKLYQQYAVEIERLAPEQVQVIVVPEKIALLSDEGTTKLDALLKETARRVRASIVVGVDRGTRTVRSNEARLYAPDGSNAVYVKQHLLPPFEDVDKPGTEIQVLQEPSGMWGMEICKDMDFPDLSRRYGAQGVGLLLVPAWDFGQDGWLHSRMAILRGVESGFTIARVAKQGLLTVSDDRGRILAEQSSASAPWATLVATAPVRHEDTLYVRWGDWFGWASVAGLVVLVGGLWFTRRGS